MERQPSSKIQLLSPQEWETLIDDFQSGVSSRQSKWISPTRDPLTLVDVTVHSLLRRDFPAFFKPYLLSFLDEFSHLLFPSPSSQAAPGLSSILDAVRAILQSPPSDSASVSTYSLKEQAMVTATSVAVSVDALKYAPRQLEILVDLLLAVINRPNHCPDRQTRALACECLREIENSCSGLLAEVSGHIWSLCQSERTHASQSYILLLTSIVNNIVGNDGFFFSASIFNTSVQLVPFNIPSYLKCLNGEGRKRGENASGDTNLKEIRKVIAFLLERPHALTPLAIMEMVSMLIQIVSVLELQGSVAALLKVQFFGLLYTFDPVLCHVVLMLYSRFSDAFAGDEQRIVARLACIAMDTQHPLVFRLLALHWLLGIASRPSDKRGLLVPMVTSFYPTVFDPLALKALKLDIIAYIASCFDYINGEKKVSGKCGDFSVPKLFGDGLICLSAFKWLPLWSTETSVAFRMLHKFLIEISPHSDAGVLNVNALSETTTFHTLQSMLVDLALESRPLVPAIAAFLDRLMECEVHKLVGERLLQNIDEYLLPKLVPDYQISLYFPIFDRIAKNETIPPSGLLKLLMKIIVFLFEKHGPDTGMRSWSQGSKVLDICRTMLMHHHSSRVFSAMSRLFIFTCQFFPDLEIRDNARVYLRMLSCVPGKKLKHIFSIGNQILGVSPSRHPASFLQVSSPIFSQNLKKSLDVSLYIHLERVVPLLVKQSWSLTIPNLGSERSEWGGLEGVRDVVVSNTNAEESETSTLRITSPDEPFCLMGSKVSRILDILRKHFGDIPDFRHMPGLRIKIPCTLRFESESFSRAWGVDIPSDRLEEQPALYASVIKFSSTSKYGLIPPCRVPFLLGEPPGTDLGIVPVGSDSHWCSSFRASVVIELEPREPMPGLVDVTIESNAENGQIITGSLQNIVVGIEDMFIKAHVPLDVPEDCIAEYHSDLFDALWEACESSTSTGSKTFPLKGGKGVAIITGTRSVKLVEVPAVSLISSIERHLAPFVVSVIGSPLIDIVRFRGVIRDVVWKEYSPDYANHNTEKDSDDGGNANAVVPYSGVTPLQVVYFENGDDVENPVNKKKNIMGCFLVLIFLPPGFHLLLQMEVRDSSTLIKIRTDHWPCLAYVDEYLEALLF